MSEIVTQAQFEERIPGYVDRAYRLGRSIVEKALSEPESGIQVGAVVAYFEGQLESVVDHATMTSLWRDANQGSTFEVDVARGDTNFGLVYSLRQASIAWMYHPEESAASPIPISSRWSSMHESSLVTPSFAFNRSHQVSSILFSDAIRMFLHAASYDRIPTEYGRYNCTTRVTAGKYREALAPRLSEAEEQILNRQGVYGLHIKHIDNLLGTMADIAGGDPSA